MANMTPIRPGQINLTGDTSALFNKKFAGEVLAAFARRCVFKARHTVRNINSGKSAQFPATWKGTADFHTVGTQLLGTQIASNERVILIDDMLIADRSIAEIDELKSDYELRAIYSDDIGEALANAYDRHCAQVGILAARASATVTGGNGGTRIIAGTVGTSVSVLEAAIFSARQALDEKDIPQENRYVFLAPAQYNLLVSGSSKIINADYNPTPNGGFATGIAKQIAGMEIVQTNNLPRTNITTGPTAYRGNFSSNVGLVMQKRATGTVQLKDLTMESAWLIEYQTTLMVGKYAVGHGILRPECAVELASSATS